MWTRALQILGVLCLTAHLGSAAEVPLGWDMAGEAFDGFAMHRCQAPQTTQDCTNFAAVSGPIAKTERMWTDTTVQDGQRYCWVVLAQHAGAWGPPSEATCTTVAQAPVPEVPPAPTRLRILNTGATTTETWITLVWNSSLQEPMAHAGFVLETCNKQGRTCAMAGMWSTPPITLSQAVRRPAPGLSQCFQVRALGNAGRSEPSNRLCVTTTGESP